MAWIEIIIYVLVAAVIVTIVRATLSLAPWVPAHHRDLKRINALSRLQPNESWYELGAGDGRVSCFIAKHNPRNQVVGLELALPFYAWCVVRRWLGRHNNLRFRWYNIFTADLCDADVVYMFGLPETVVGRLQDKLKNELRPGARVLSYAFEMKGWKADAASKPQSRDTTIYCYTMPQH